MPHTRGAPTNCLLQAPGEGTHRLSSLGVMPWGGRPQGAPLPIVFFRRYALGRAPTRGAPTNCLFSALCPGEGAPQCPGEGTHKGRPYQLSFFGVMPWGGRPPQGHPQGAPLPIVFFRRYALGRAPTRGAPTNCLFSALCPGEGTHKGAPHKGPTRGAPTNCLFSALCPGEGAHKGRPYRLSFFGVMPWGGRPQGAPLPIVFLQALCPEKGGHLGRPYRLSFFGVMPWGGHPQGAPLPIVFFRRYALGRAPTRGAPTNCLFSALCPEKGAHKGRPYPIQAASRGFVSIGCNCPVGQPFRASSKL